MSFEADLRDNSEAMVAMACVRAVLTLRGAMGHLLAEEDVERLQEAELQVLQVLASLDRLRAGRDPSPTPPPLAASLPGDSLAEGGTLGDGS